MNWRLEVQWTGGEAQVGQSVGLGAVPLCGVGKISKYSVSRPLIKKAFHLDSYII